MFCNRCGAQIEDNLAFCPECGAAIMTDDDKTVAAPIGEKTLKVSYDDPTAVDADATIVADGNNSETFREDATLAADTVKKAVNPVKQNSLAKSKEAHPKSKKAIIIAIAAVLLVLLVAVVVFFKFKTDKESEATAPTTALSTEQAIPENVVVIDVPALEGKTLEEAEQILGGKITYEVVETYSDDVEAGKIVSQFPQGGSQVTPGTLVHISVSLGKEDALNQSSQKIIPAEYAVINPSSVALLPGQTAKVKVTIYPENATSKDYIITFDDYIVASVDADNNVMAISSGSTIMRVVAPDGKELATMNVTVKEPATQPPVTQAPAQSPTKAPVQQAPTQAPRYKVSLDANGGTVDTASISVKQNGTYGTLPVPEKSGYTFSGWYTTNGAKVTSSSEIAFNYDHTLKAQWTAVVYTVTLDANGGSVSTSSMRVNHGSSAALPTPKRDYYTFKGWFTERSGGTQVTSSTKIYSSDTLYARWSENSYTSWSTSAPPANVSSSQIKTRTLYSYRDKETTASSSSDLGNGWILENTTTALGDYGAWQGWSKTKPTESANREIETRTVTDKAAYTEYTYGRWVHSCSCSGKYTALKYCSNSHAGTFKTLKTTSPLTLIISESWGKQYKTSDGQLWFVVDNYSGSNYGGSKKIPAVTHKEYRYRDRVTVYTYHYYRWSAWSDWSTTSYSKSSTREVKTQTQYSYRPK